MRLPYKFKPRANKYNAKKCVIDGMTFDSQAEGRRYSELKLLVRADEAKTFLRQPSFDLGGGVKYRADFMVFWTDGFVSVEDVKGVETKSFVLKKKIVEARYPFEIDIVKYR